MKKLLISILACLCIGATALGVSACSDDEVVQGPQGSQGEQGIQGEQGPQGEKGDKGDAGSDGQDGSDGRDGVDGSDGQDGEDGEDGITPQLKIGTDNYWYVSYDNGVTWISLGVKATGANGQDGQNGQNGSDGADGEDGSDGRDGVDGSDGQDGSDGRDGVDGSDGQDGEDGITPQLKIGDDNYWYVSYDEGETWESLNIKATGSDGATGATGATGVGIQSITINADGDFVVTYTNGTTQTVVAPNKHTHTYGAWKWYGNGDQTCENRLYYQLCATCGDIAWREGSNDDHKWEATVTTQPTCQAMGYDSKVCEICEKVVKSNYVNSLGHSYVYHEAKAATCTENGWYAYKTCSRAGCGYTTYQTQYSTGHSYTNYIYNEDATCTANGTKTAVCDNGCGATKTLTATNTILAHIYAEGICIRCEALQTQGLRYALNSAKTAYTVTGLGSCSVADVVIPAKYNNLPVTAIGERAFEGESSITSVVIPDSVTAIEMYAFSGCRNLTNITLGNKVESIGILAFEQTNITSINIPASMKQIGSAAFFGNSCKAVYITDLTAWCEIEFGSNLLDSPYAGEFSNPLWQGKLYLNGELVTELVIPDGVTEIKPRSFCRYSDLVSVSIPDSVTKIGDYAFLGCSNLTSVEIPDSVTSIGKYAFSSCGGLTSIEIPDSVTTISNSAFRDCTALTEIKYNAIECTDLTGGSVSAKNGVFSGAGTDGTGVEVTIGAKVKKIPAHLFSPDFNTSTTNIVGVEFEDGSVCETIGKGAFESCDKLTSIALPNSLLTIGGGAFAGCSGLSGNLEIPHLVTEIAYSAFAHCSGLTSVTIGENITAIGERAFYDCRDLTTIYVDVTLEEWEEVEKDASWCDTSVQVVLKYSQGLQYQLNAAQDGYTVTGIGSCQDTDMRISPTYQGLPVTAIASCAFMDCSNLTSVVIPDSVITIGNDAFMQCGNLTSVTLGNGVESIGYTAFALTNIISINIPASLKKIDSGAFYKQALDVYVTDLAAWCGIEFGVAGDSTSAFPDEGPNPLTYGGKLYLNGELVTELVIPDTVTEIKSKVFYKYDSLTSVFIPASVTKIGKNAFGGCANLTEIALENDENTDHSKWKIEGYAENRYWSMGGTWETSYYPYEETLVVYTSTSLLLSGSKIVQFENNANDWTLYYASCTWTRMSHGVYKTVVTEATCEDDGYTTYTCNCGKTYITNYVSALGHDYVSHEAQEETCEEAGWAAYVACSHSGCTDTTYVEIPALGHDYVSHEAQEETCEEAGWEAYRTCSRCDYTEYEEISALGHDYETLFTAPTATRDGCTEYTCSICGDNFIENIIPVAFSINGNNRNMVPFEGGYYKGGKVQDFIIPAVFQYDDVWYRVTGIEREAFGTPILVGENKEYHLAVKTIVIPDSVAYIDSLAFAFPGRNGLTNVVVGASNKNFVSVDGSLYTKDMKTILLYAYGKTDTTFTIPSGVTTIAAGAFYGANLKTVVIPDTVTIIENYAFARSYVTDIDISRSLVFIGYAAFSDTSLGSCEFLSTGSWYVTKNEEDWKDKVGGTYVKSTDIKHINTAAQYLRSTYCAYYWYKVV